MCELLGMSASVPTDICFSFTGLIRRGGHTGPHKDGWGIAFYDGKGCRTFHDPAASAHSPIADFLRGYSIKSEIAISHIRRANRGKVALENTHPFVREMWGQNWVFAHNGQVAGAKHLTLSHYRPVGSTDSEHVFCWMLGRLRDRWTSPPAERTLRGAIAELVAAAGAQGVFNMLLSNGRSLYCHRSTNLVWLTRRAPFKAATLVDEDLTVDFAKHTTPSDVVTIVATRPLTSDEPWESVPKGRLVTFRDGEIKGL
ncbi:MAG TPA: class II glutamine amidotransferase [Alphaproteobacteria bacterium]|jgi:glutamine amidotransferase|nr:class II glutamine amidotransferase [Alphaproteobacteria bacterium]